MAEESLRNVWKYFGDVKNDVQEPKYVQLTVKYYHHMFPAMVGIL